MADLRDKVKKLLNKGYSGSKIAKKLHIRKQTALDLVRELKGTAKRVNSNPYGQKGKPLSENLQGRITRLYKQGKTLKQIHSELKGRASYKKISAFVRDLPADVKDKHKLHMYETRKKKSQMKAWKEPASRFYGVLIMDTQDVSGNYTINLTEKAGLSLQYRLDTRFDVENFLDEVADRGQLVATYFFWDELEGKEVTEEFVRQVIEDEN